jgi:hypothetical protein
MNTTARTQSSHFYVVEADQQGPWRSRSTTEAINKLLPFSISP